MLLHPTIRASFFLVLDQGGETEALGESHQAFQVTAGPKLLDKSVLFSLIKLVFWIASICLLIS